MGKRDLAQAVLLLPCDAVIGGLMDELLRFAGYRAMTLGEDESPQQGLARVDPELVFVDCDHPSALSAELRQTATERGAPVVLFSGSRTERELRQIAGRHGAFAFSLPNGPRALRRAIEALLDPPERNTLRS